MAPFWDSKCLQKSSEILEAILEVKKGARTTPSPLFWGRPGGMRGVPGEDNGGVRERTPDKNRGREPRRRQGTLEVGSSTPSPVGRRIAPRIPPGWGYYPSSVAEASSAAQRRVAQQHAYRWVWLRAGAISSPALKKLEQPFTVTYI